MFGPLEIPQESLLLQRFAGNEPILDAKKRTLPQIWNLQNMEIFVISTTSYRNLQGKSLMNWMNITFLERIILDKRCTKYFLNKKFYQKCGSSVYGDFRCGHFAAIISTNGNLLGEINGFQNPQKFCTFWSENPGCLRSCDPLEVILKERL